LKHLLALIFTFTLIGCTTNNEEDYFGVICDSDNVYYLGSNPNQSISNIIASKCLGCHLEDNTISYLSLETYPDVQLISNLDEVINNVDNPMPPEGSLQLTDCEKLQIESWVHNGFRYDEEQR
jgi:hypothetical protein